MDVEKMREGALALVVAAGLGLAWLVLADSQAGEYAALGALLAAAVGLWRVGAGLAARD